MFFFFLESDHVEALRKIKNGVLLQKNSVQSVMHRVLLVATLKDFGKFDLIALLSGQAMSGLSKKLKI